MSTRSKRMLKIAPFALMGAAVFAWLGGQIVRLLWNWLVPSLFGLPAITFWQALGLLVLCRILFGGHGGGSSRSWSRTPEERERFRRRIRERFGMESEQTNQ